MTKLTDEEVLRLSVLEAIELFGRKEFGLMLIEQDAIAELCQNKDMQEHACKNRHQCWEPCGELGKSQEHAKAAIHCKYRRENNGVCPHPNLQCGWPKCNEVVSFS